MIKPHSFLILLTLTIISGTTFAQEIENMGSIFSCPGAGDVAISGTSAYLSESSGLLITSVDISNTEAPTINASYSDYNTSFSLDVEDDLLVSCLRTDPGGFALFSIDQGFITGELSSVSISYVAMAVLLEQDICYIACTGGLYIFDVTDPESPEELSFLQLESGAYHLDLDNNLLVMSISDICRIIDVSNPSAPSLLSTITSEQSEGNFLGGDIVDDLLYTAGWNGLRIYSLENPSNPVLIGEYTEYYHYSRAVKVIGDIACVSNGSSGMMTIDVSDPQNPEYLGLVETPDFVADIEILDNNTLILTDCSVGLIIIDISIPSSPVREGHPEINGKIKGGIIANNYAYLQLNIGISEHEIVTIDLTSGSPEEMNFGIPVDHELDYGVQVGNYLYILDSVTMDWDLTSCTIYTYDVSNPSRPDYENEIEFSPALLDIAFQDEILYMLMYHYEGYPTENNELVIADISDGPEPDILYTGSFDFYARMIATVDDHLIIQGAEINGWDIDSTAFYFYDISSPQEPLLVGSQLLDSCNVNSISSMRGQGSYLYTTTTDTTLNLYYFEDNNLELINRIELSDNFRICHLVDNILVIESQFENRILLYDLSDPMYPTMVESFTPEESVYGISKLSFENDGPSFINSIGVQASFYNMADFLSIDESQMITPVHFQVGNLYPNPFNSSVTIPLEISRPGSVKLSIYNILGQKIDGYDFFLNAGEHLLPFQSQNIASGMYTVVIEHRGEQQARTMYLLK